MLINLLEHCPRQSLSGQSLEKLIESLLADSGFRRDNHWVVHFQQTLAHYLAETSGSRLPVRHFIHFIHDFSREARQSWLFQQDNLPVSTMHGVKGLEFPVVIVAGQPSNHAALEEERRLYYVALTRARDRLICLSRKDGWNPFVDELQADGQVRVRQENPELSPEESRACRTELWELGLSDLVISFPAYPSVLEQAQAALTEMEPGDSRDLTILEQGENLFITYKGKPIARFSARGKQDYQQRMARGLRVERVIFLAAIHRQRQEPESENSLEAAASWYTGLFQLLLQTQTGDEEEIK
ncbi:MAG: ATP-binding domain-containing protein, partial [Desulfohalobiaceae bacterium]|nr:ATP-binding domain-containing protein [Desulfohalobiaceae bacterium]